MSTRKFRVNQTGTDNTAGRVLIDFMVSKSTYTAQYIGPLFRGWQWKDGQTVKFDVPDSFLAEGLESEEAALKAIDDYFETNYRGLLELGEEFE